MLGKVEGTKRRGQQRMRWLDGIANSMDMSLSITRSWWWTGKPGVLQFMGSQRIRHDWVTELNWTEWTPRYILLSLRNIKVKILCKKINSIRHKKAIEIKLSQKFWQWLFLWQKKTELYIKDTLGKKMWGIFKKIHKQQMLDRVWRKGKLSALLVGI